MNKDKLLIVGAFPPANKKIYGGIHKSCKILLNSSLSEKFNLITIDSSQSSNPVPHIIIRSFSACKRIILLISKLIFEKPKAALIFTSDGFSAIEKGVMCVICSLFNCKAMIFPRAGNLIIQTKNSRAIRFLIRFLFNKATIFLCQGRKWKKFAINQIGFKPSNVMTINNWTATKEHIKIGLDRNYDKNDGTKKLLFVGWLEEFKGVFDLLEASKSLIQQGYKFQLTFAGDGNAKAQVQEYIKNYNLSSYIKLEGWVDDTNLLRLLENNDIFILPSWSEGLPNSMIEAMSAGLSVIVSDVGAISDFIKHDKNGLITKPKDIDGLRDAISSLLDDNLKIKRNAINGHKLAVSHFSSEIGIKLLISVIEEIIDKK